MKTESVIEQLEIGRHPLHLAVATGDIDVIKTIIGRGADPNCQDQNGDTPLHLATLYGHVNIVAYLVAHNANIEVKNKAGHTALYNAIMDKNPEMVEMLLSFGVDPSVTEWQWVEKSYGPTEIKILEVFDRHCHLIPGFKNGLVKKDLLFVQPNKLCEGDSIPLTVESESVTQSFVLQCYKVPKEYCSTKFVLDESVHCITDVFEVRIWMSTCREVHFTTVVKQCMKMKLTFLGVENCTGTVRIMEKDDQSEQETVLAIKLRMKNPRHISKFVICYNEVKERISVIKFGNTVKVESFPGFVINVPENVVTRDIHLEVQVISADDILDEKGNKVFGNNLLYFSTIVQFLGEVKLSFPVTCLSNKTVSLVMVDVDDNKIKDLPFVVTLTDEETVKTKTLHSLYAILLNENISGDYLTRIHEMLQASLEHKRKVVFIILTKEEMESESHTIVVHCTLAEQRKLVEERWNQKGFVNVGESEMFSCCINTVFKICIKGNIEDLFHTNQMDLELHLYRDNFRMFNVTKLQANNKMEGEIIIKHVIPKHRTGVVGSAFFGCTACGGRKQKQSHLDHFHTIYSCSISFEEKENVDEKRTPLHQVFNGFRLIRLHRQNKIQPE